MSIDLISKYRSELMGFATIWILCYHFCEDFSVSVLDYFSCIGYGGVDIFLFLSGFGLTVGYKYKNCLSFYKKRFLRIYPSYLIILVLWYAIRADLSIKDALVASTGIGFFVERFHNWTWYVPFMYLLYLIFPAWIFITKNSNEIKNFTKINLYTLGVCSIGLLWSAYLIKGQIGPMIILAATRVPIFFIGSLFGFFYIYKKGISNNLSWSLAIASLIALVGLIYCRKTFEFHFLWVNGIFWLPFMVIVPGLSLLLSKTFSLFHQYVSATFKFIGSVSLEVYLIHSIALHYLTQYYLEAFQQHPYLWLLLFISVCTFISKIYQMAINATLKMFHIL